MGADSWGSASLHLGYNCYAPSALYAFADTPTLHLPWLLLRRAMKSVVFNSEFGLIELNSTVLFMVRN
jgi:hypothetical protein